MQIQCPHCKSRYRLGSEMIDAYGGFVRCGNCNYKFNIHDQVLLEDELDDLLNTGKSPAQYSGETNIRAASSPSSRSARIEPRLERDAQEDGFNIRFGQNEYENEVEVTSAEKSQIREPQLDPSDESLEDDMPGNFQFPESLDELDVSAVEEFGEIFDQLTEDSLEQESATEELDSTNPELWQETVSYEEPVVFDSLHEEGFEEDTERLALINDDAEQDSYEPGLLGILFSMLWRTIQLLFWVAAVIALAYLLFGQVKDTLYPAYKNHSLVQQIRSSVCAYLPCDDTKYDLDLFEIVVSRMDEVSEPSRQLHISIFLLNKAKNAQAYPNILLTLKTIDGGIAGQRVIGPGEYLTSQDSLISSRAGTAPEAGALVKPNKLGKILIKLNKPPANAVGFEARVVK
ncbi:MAG: DUF3426 domain-containing protein [Proteobacteria bacterium]|nr:DUF3426 domain-containing protein [Pseudomonadota bacterium]